jgi:hypothetical protein
MRYGGYLPGVNFQINWLSSGQNRLNLPASRCVRSVKLD